MFHDTFFHNTWRHVRLTLYQKNQKYNKRSRLLFFNTSFLHDSNFSLSLYNIYSLFDPAWVKNFKKYRGVKWIPDRWIKVKASKRNNAVQDFSVSGMYKKSFYSESTSCENFKSIPIPVRMHIKLGDDVGDEWGRVVSPMGVYCFIYFVKKTFEFRVGLEEQVSFFRNIYFFY